MSLRVRSHPFSVVFRRQLCSHGTIKDVSYVLRGTTFEETAVTTLAGVGFHLRRSGGPYDGGLDLKV